MSAMKKREAVKTARKFGMRAEFSTAENMERIKLDEFYFTKDRTELPRTLSG